MHDALRALVLGFVQGMTEFLPISSSGHLRIVSSALGWRDPGAAFTAITQLGTEAAVLIYFRRDLWRIASTWLRSLRDHSRRADPDARIGWYIIVATIPIGLLGYLLKDQIESGARNLYLIGASLVIFGLFMAVADASASLRRTTDGLDVRSGVLIGLAQSLALVPGVSRSGATITAGLLLGLTREAAARFAFLIAVPAVLASGLYELLSLARGSSPGSEPWWAITLATIVAFAVGLAVIAWLLRYLARNTLRIFVLYRLALGLLVIGGALTGLLH